MEVFVIEYRNLEGRVDPHFYNPIFLESVAQIKKAKHKSLDNLVFFSDEIWNQQDLYSDTFPYIEIGDINTETGEIENISYIKKENAPSRAKKIVRENDIIISLTRPNRGAISFIDQRKDGFIASTGFSVLRDLINDDIEKRYLFYSLRQDFSLTQMLQRSSGGNYPAIIQDELGKILIPIPPKPVQVRIIRIMDEAYARKKQNEEEAERLLNSIDEILCSHLGIKIVEYKKANIAVLDSSEIHNRLDPLSYISDKTDFIVGEIGLTELKSVCEYFKSGFAAGKHSQAKDSSGIIQIRPTNIDSNGRLNFEKNIYIDHSEGVRRKEDLIVKGEVLFNNTNSQELVGKSAFSNLDGEYFCSNHITRIKTKQQQLLPEYLWIILNLYQRHGHFFRICTNWNNQSGVNANLLKSIRIPLPGMDIQKSVIKGIDDIFHRSDELGDESNHIIEQAKREVEKILFKSMQ
jgi:type I restriction enzyme S subunit